MTLKNSLKAYAKAIGIARRNERYMNIVTIKQILDAMSPLIRIADKFDANQLRGAAQKRGCCGLNETPVEEMVLVHDFMGRPLLTVADCLKARELIHGKEGQGQI